MLNADRRTTQQVQETRCQRNGKPYTVTVDGMSKQKNHYTCLCGKAGVDFCKLGSAEERTNRAISLEARNVQKLDKVGEQKTHKDLTILDANIPVRMVQSAENYALADKSDPFALRRAFAHMRMGIARTGQDGSDAGYSATPTSEKRIAADGSEYTVTAYKNIIRP